MEPAAVLLRSPTGKEIPVPTRVESENDPYASLRDDQSLRDYYDREGYVVCRGLVPADLCDRARDAFHREVKPFGGLLYRQATANLERHKFTSRGHMLNSILNIQDLDASRFPRFREAGLSIITHSNVISAVRALVDEPPKVVQTMFFEGNPATWAHQDTYYLDAAEIGRMVAAWIAVEDIAPGAGRFYVYPRSHAIDMARNGGQFDIAFNHPRYKKLVIDVIERHRLACHVPAMAKGDVLFWSSKTIHGSLDTTDLDRSRSSFTAHYIPQSLDFLQYQTRRKALRLQTIGGVPVHCPKDQNQLHNRAVAWVEGTFPRSFQLLKRAAIKLVTR